MGTLYIDRKDLEIRVDGEALAFYSNGKREGLTPIKPLKRVVICGKVLLESSVLHKLADKSISVLFLSGKRLKFRGILHGRLHNNGLLRLKQYEKSHSKLAEVWAIDLVKKKLIGHIDILQEAKERRPDRRRELTKGLSTLESVFESIEGLGQGMCERLRGLEGGAASAYYSAYTTLFPESLGFKKRQKRPPTDPVNALLSLTYTLIHWEAVREIEVIGLDPTIGFYHEFEYGRESLACDLIEPLRPHVDKWIWGLFRDRTFTAQHFTTGNERPGCYLKKVGRKQFYFLYEEWVKELRSLLVENARDLSVKIMDKEDGANPLPERK